MGAANEGSVNINNYFQGLFEKNYYDFEETFREIYVSHTSLKMERDQKRTREVHREAQEREREQERAQLLQMAGISTSTDTGIPHSQSDASGSRSRSSQLGGLGVVRRRQR